MRELSVTEVKRRFGAALEAAQRGPLFIKKQHRAVANLLSAQRLCDEIAGKAAAPGLDDEVFSPLMHDVS